MAGAIEGIRTFNSLFRTLLLAAGVGVAGYGGYLGYNHYVRPGIQAIADLEKARAENGELSARISQLAAELKELRILNEKLQTSLKLIKTDRRMARIDIIETGSDGDGRPWMKVKFIETDRTGKSIGEPQEFNLAGDKMFVDAWLVKFDDHFIEDADLFRNATLCVFKGIYGDLDGPSGAREIDSGDPDQVVPTGYATGDVNEFEKKIWYDFWSVANDPVKQREMGIRAAHGQANYVQVQSGQSYLLELRASDGMTLKAEKGVTLDQ